MPHHGLELRLHHETQQLELYCTIAFVLEGTSMFLPPVRNVTRAHGMGRYMVQVYVIVERESRRIYFPTISYDLRVADSKWNKAAPVVVS